MQHGYRAARVGGGARCPADWVSGQLDTDEMVVVDISHLLDMAIKP